MNTHALHIKAEQEGARSAIHIISLDKTDGDTIRGLVGGYMEVAARGKVNGVPCVLICDEEGRLKPQPEANWAAADLATTMTNNPAFLFSSVFGDCVLLCDTEEDWRTFTADELKRIIEVLHVGGFNIVDATVDV